MRDFAQGARQVRKAFDIIPEVPGVSRMLAVRIPSHTLAQRSWAVASGTFIMGLRCVGRPVVLACWGKIAGPSWGFVLCCDYRIRVANLGLA